MICLCVRVGPCLCALFREAIKPTLLKLLTAIRAHHIFGTADFFDKLDVDEFIFSELHKDPPDAHTSGGSQGGTQWKPRPPDSKGFDASHFTLPARVVDGCQQGSDELARRSPRNSGSKVSSVEC